MFNPDSEEAGEVEGGVSDDSEGHEHRQTPNSSPQPPCVCQLTQEALDHYLAESGYGADMALFLAYFRRDPVTMLPRCAACDQLIDEHAVTPDTRIVVIPTVMDAGITVVGTPVPSKALPFGMERGSTGFDTYTPRVTYAFDYTAMALCVAFVGYCVGLFASGAFTNGVNFVFAGLLILCLIVVGSIPQISRIRFSKEYCAAAKVIITRRRLFGCTTEEHTTMAELGQVGLREVPSRAATAYAVAAMKPYSDCSGGAVVLFTSRDYAEAVAQYRAWVAYFHVFGITAHPRRFFRSGTTRRASLQSS